MLTAAPKSAETRRVKRAYIASRIDRMDYPPIRLDGLSALVPPSPPPITSFNAV